MKRNIFLTESQISFIKENVFISKDKYDKKNRTIGLEYNDDGRNKNAYKANDSLKTDKMHQQNGDTYEVTLKDGTICYNITSIKGMEVMHYFKKTWAKKEKTTIKQNDNKEKELTLTMEERELIRFLQNFCKKVGFVVNYVVKNKFTKEEDIAFSKVSLYPVPSSSPFNQKICELLDTYNLKIGNLPIQIINSNIIQKDLRDIQRDEAFIERNKDFYNSNFTAIQQEKQKTVSQQLDNRLSKLSLRSFLNTKVEELNNIVNEIDKYYKRINTKNIEKICELYIKYLDIINEVKKQTNNRWNGDYIKPQKYSKPIREKKTEVIKNIILSYNKNALKKFPKLEIIHLWEVVPFEIKNLSNGERMGIKNIYNTNQEDIEMVQQELEKIKGTIFVMFDDNVSGGATLSDIVRECKEQGINYIIPITFGEMNEKWTIGMIPLTKPKMEKGHAIWNTK